jgi:hypothetical protein
MDRTREKHRAAAAVAGHVPDAQRVVNTLPLACGVSLNRQRHGREGHRNV